MLRAKNISPQAADVIWLSAVRPIFVVGDKWINRLENTTGNSAPGVMQRMHAMNPTIRFYVAESRPDAR